jgi:hypothetical protein
LEVAGSQHSPSPSPAPPQQIWLLRLQQVWPQHVAVDVSQQVSPQPTWSGLQQLELPGFGLHVWLAVQQASPQHLTAD